MSKIILLMLSILPLLQGRHVNCPHICKRRSTREDISTEHDDPNEEFVPTGKKHCYGKICVVTTHQYYTHEVPHAWSVPVHGTAHGGEDVCKDKSYVLEVGTSVDVFKVRGIDEKNKFLDIDLYLSMAWEDPEIGVCVCDDKHHKGDGSYQVGSNLEELIWLPDLHVWNSKSMTRVNGLVKLGDMELKLRKNCPAKITWGYDVQLRLLCQMTMDMFPYDQNICHVKFGSYSHFIEELVFYNGEETMKHSFAKTNYKDYKIKVIPLCDHQTVVNVTDVHGGSSQFKVSGFSLVITRSSNRIFGEYVLILSTIVSAAIISAILPLKTARASLVATAQLTVIFLLDLIDDNTPRGDAGSNLIVIYTVVCLGFNLVTFMEYCILKAILRWSKMNTPDGTKKLERVDKVFSIVWLLVFLLFNLVWWQWTPGYSPTECQNEKYSSVDCSISNH